MRRITKYTLRIESGAKGIVLFSQYNGDSNDYSFIICDSIQHAFKLMRRRAEGFKVEATTFTLLIIDGNRTLHREKIELSTLSLIP